MNVNVRVFQWTLRYKKQFSTSLFFPTLERVERGKKEGKCGGGGGVRNKEEISEEIKEGKCGGGE